MKSIWSEFPMPRFDPLDGNLHTDVLVIGGGMAGLLCAHVLQEAGIRCVVAEADRIAGGITCNTTAKLTAQHGLCYHKIAKKSSLEAAQIYLRTNLQALSAYATLCNGIDCDYETQTHYVYSLRSRALLDKELKILQKLRFDAGFRDEVDLPFPTLGAVVFPDQAQFHPRKFLAAIVRKLTIYENTPVLRLEKNCAITPSGTIQAEKIVVATHFPFLNTHGSYFMKLYQQRSYVLAVNNAAFAGMYLDEQTGSLSFRSYGDTLLLGGGGHRTGTKGDGWLPLEAFVREYYPGCEITHRWAAQDCMSLDTMPYVGHYSALMPNLYVATGFNKWGMTGAMAAAQLLTDQLLGKPNPALSRFSPSRSILRPQLAANLLESTANLLKPTVPRCPHLGCALKWNPQEHSWDCPCHGSRFSEDGHLLDNPATHDLKKRQ